MGLFAPPPVTPWAKEGCRSVIDSIHLLNDASGGRGFGCGAGWVGGAGQCDAARKWGHILQTDTRLRADGESNRYGPTFLVIDTLCTLWLRTVL